MSTKIYDAYRVKKNVKLQPLLNRFTQISTDTLGDNAMFLYAIHMYSIALAEEEVGKDVDKEDEKRTSWAAKRFLEDETPDCWWMQKKMKEAELDPMRGNPLSVDFACSVGWDRRYWYIKFFANGIANKMMDAIEAGCPELEDYHYQDQCDPPADVPYKQFRNRCKKWDSLTEPYGNYRGMLSYKIFDEYNFGQMMSKHYYTGEKDLYKHLAYKFDKVKPVVGNTVATE